MANTNPRDVTPDDFAYDNVPDYEAPHAAPLEDKILGGSTAATPQHRPAEPVTTETTETAAFETAALDREPVYIEPADPVYEEVIVSSEPVADPVAAAPAPVGRGTTDFGLLLLRLSLGGYLVLAALSTFFRLGESGGIGGLETAFSPYPFGDGMAIMVPTLQLAAGVFLVLGLITPVASAVAVAVTAFMALHAVVASGAGWNLFAWDAGVWLPLVLFAVALAIQFTGPGLYGVDAGRSWARRPLVSSWVWLLVGLAAAGLMWWFATNINPLAI